MSTDKAQPSIIKYAPGIVSDIGFFVDAERNARPENFSLTVTGATAQTFSEIKKKPPLKKLVDAYYLKNKAALDATVLFSRTAEEKDNRLVILADEAEEIILNIKNTGPTFGYILIMVPEKKHCSIIEQLELPDYCGLIIEVAVLADAKVTYTHDPNPTNANLSLLRQGYVEGDAALDWFDIAAGNGFAKIDTVTHLLGSGGEARTHGLFVGTQNSQFDIYHRTEHHAPRTRSMTETKGLMAHNAKTIYRSLIAILPGQNQCVGAERADVLLLSKDAQISAVPDLEIGNNEVQCTHSSSISRLSDQTLFYAQSRGLDEVEARRLLVEAHAAPIVDKIGNEDIRKKIGEIITSSLTFL